MPPADPPPLLFVTVGTDHHPFDRLMGWIESWLRTVDTEIECFVQSGTSRSPVGIPSSPYLSHTQMQDLCARAFAVVCHGGPATITDSRKAGRKPIVLPRREMFGEHVDDHQLRFARRVAESGYIQLVEDELTLHRMLDVALKEPATLSADPAKNGLSESARRFAALADPLLSAR